MKRVVIEFLYVISVLSLLAIVVGITMGIWMSEDIPSVAFRIAATGMLYFSLGLSMLITIGRD